MATQTETQAEQAGMKRKLAWRMGFAGVMIVMLLGTLAVFDRLSAPDEPESPSPQFTEPVPVPKKDITQPVKPAEPAPEAAPAEPKPAEPEATTAPPEAPARPEVAAQPALPRAQSSAESRTMPLSRPQPPAPALPAAPSTAPSAAPAPALPSAAPTQPPRAEEHAPAARQPAAPTPAPAPAGSTFGGRLFSGFALQAGVFSDPRLAEELHAKLTLNGIPSTLEARVQVGPFKTREEAEAARAKMKALGIDAVLLTPPKGAIRR